jgi:hypothetical protein
VDRQTLLLIGSVIVAGPIHRVHDVRVWWNFGIPVGIEEVA